VLDLLEAEDVSRLAAFYGAFRARHEEGFMASVLTTDVEARARIHAEVCEVLGRRVLSVLDDYRMVVGSYAVKQAACEDSFVGLHQDLSFVDEPERLGVSLWCPLVDVDAGNGGLSVVRGSHVLNSHYREPCSLPYDDALVEHIDARYLAPLPMRAGQALLMDSRLFHGSPPNRAAAPRVVAAGVAVPREARLLYCHRDLEGDGDVLELFEVPDDFYLRHTIGQRPREGRHAATVPRRVEQLSEERLRAHCAGA
jgi:ectoine hydroxylase-related dioxygenase (phytanoyl-CoA dioxygenase family)